MSIKYNPFTGQFDIVGGTGSVTAADVSVVPSGNLTSTNVQDALEELQLDIDNYENTFNNTTDWVGPSGGFYTITIAQVTHQKGINPQIQILELDGINYNIVDVDRVQINVAGDIEIRVPTSPDLRFNGKIVIGS